MRINDPIAVLRVVSDRYFEYDSLRKTHRAEHTNELPPGVWTTFASNIPGNGHLLWVTNSGGANQPWRFYRGAMAP